MKKNILVVLMIITSIVLVGCNSGDANPSNNNMESGNTNPNGNSQVVDNQVENDQGASEQPANALNGDEPDTIINENELVYTSKGQEITEKTSVVESDNQQFKIALLPEFTLSAEEPGKDVVLYSTNDNVYMRIETVAVADTSYEEMLQSTKAFMDAGSTLGTTLVDEGIKQLAPANVKNVDAFRNDYENDSVVALLFETDTLFVKLTVFDSKDVDLTEAMLKMGATISAK